MTDNELKDLLIHLQNNEMDYFDAFYEGTKKQVFFMIYSYIQNHDISEDLLQDTYIKFLKYLKRINPNQNIFAYLLQIAKSVSLNYLKKHKRLKLSDDDEMFDVEVYEQKTNNDLLLICQSILSQAEYQVIILHLVEELTHKEIASLLNRPLGTITWMYNNALKKVRRKLDNGKQD